MGVITSWKVTLGVLLIYRFARTKSKPLANILMIYSNKKIKSCSAKWRRERELQKKISRSNEKKKQLCTSSTLFCAFLFFVVLHDYNVKHLIYTSYVGNVVMLPECFFTFVLVRFFSLPLIFTWLAASISHFVTANFHVLYQRNSAPLFLSNTLALSLLSTSVKTLQFSRSRLCRCCCFSL